MLFFMKKIYIALTLFLFACQSNKEIPVVEINQTLTNLTVVGAVEPLYILPIKSPFESRIDTGAQTSSIDAYNIKTFERDGKPFVSFYIKNKKSNESFRFEKEISRRTTITRTGKDEKRIVVILDVKFMGNSYKKEFSLNNRTAFEFQGLIGRNILQGNYIVDVSTTHTSY